MLDTQNYRGSTDGLGGMYNIQDHAVAWYIWYNVLHTEKNLMNCVAKSYYKFNPSISSFYEKKINTKSNNKYIYILLYILCAVHKVKKLKYI